jgi:beta-1,4-mannosyl-glycoprotein beta-1,4-N-acetylglucosaminyltransferase
LLTSDVDEIPKARFVWALENCDLPDPFPSLLLKCEFYYYSYEFRDAFTPYWSGVTVSRFGPNKSVTLDLRKIRNTFRPMLATCFHCSYCFDRISSVREKIGSFSHTELDIEKYRNQQHIVDRFKNGKDLFDRCRQSLRRTTENETELPRLLKQQPQRFMYMLNRSSSANAAFRDVL